MMGVREQLKQWEHPTQVLFSTADPIFHIGVGQGWVDRVPGANELELVDGAGHFLQEDQGEEVAAKLITFLQRTD